VGLCIITVDQILTFTQVHDAESFFYVLTFHIKDDKVRHPLGEDIYDRWHDLARAHRDKLAWLFRTVDIPVDPQHETCKAVRKAMHAYIKSDYYDTWLKARPAEVFAAISKFFEEDPFFPEWMQRVLPQSSERESLGLQQASLVPAEFNENHGKILDMWDTLSRETLGLALLTDRKGKGKEEVTT
jgi:hypothetical protein